LAVIGPWTIWSSNGGHSTNKISHGDKSTASDNLYFAKIRTRDGPKNNTVDPTHFKKSTPPNCPAHLAHAIAAQTHRGYQSYGKSQIPSLTSMVCVDIDRSQSILVGVFKIIIP
jgi:hypothetical protein